jgi:hypothetical protein
MFDVAKRREPSTEKREDRRDLYLENDIPLEGGRVPKSVREMVGYKQRIPIGRGELRRAIQRAIVWVLGTTERYYET